MLYARTLLDILKEGNEQYVSALPDTLYCTNTSLCRSSNTTSTLSDLGRTLNTVEQSYRIRLSSPAPTPAHNPALIALPMSPVPSNPISTRESKSHAPTPVIPQTNSSFKTAATALPGSGSGAGTSAAVTGVRKRRTQTDDYLARRARETTTGEETSLLPLKDAASHSGKTSKDGKKARDDLLGDMSEKAGLGSAQLHEELGGQLADVRAYPSPSIFYCQTLYCT